MNLCLVILFLHLICYSKVNFKYVNINTKRLLNEEFLKLTSKTSLLLTPVSLTF